MKKTLFLSQARNVSQAGLPCMEADYIFFDRGKWRQDTWRYLSEAEIKKEAKKQGYLIK